MAAQGEEAVVDADAWDAEHVGEQSGKDFLKAAAWRPACCAGRGGGCGQGGPVELAVGGQWQRVDRLDDGRHHVGGQVECDVCGERPWFWGVSGGGDDVGDEVPVAGQVLADQYAGGAHGRVGAEHCLDLGGFDAVAAQFDLLVRPGHVVQRAVDAPAHQVAGAVHACAGAGERIGDEPGGGEAGPPQVSAGDAGARDVQLPFGARRHGAHRRVQDVGAHAVERSADRGRAAGGGIGAHVVGGGEGGGLGGPVDVEDDKVRVGGGDALQDSGCGGLASGGDQAQQAEGVCVGFGPYVEQGGRQERRGHAVPGYEVPEHGGLERVLGRHDDTAPVEERGPDLEGGGVEDVRRVHQNGVGRAVAPVPVGPECCHVGVSDADPLGQSGGSGGEHHVREPGAARDSRQGTRGVRASLPDGACGVYGQHGYGRVQLTYPGVCASAHVDDQDAQGGHLGHTVEPFGGPARVERHIDGTCAQDSQGGGDRGGRAGHEDADGVLESGPEPGQGAGQTVREIAELPIGQLLARPGHGHDVRVPGGAYGQGVRDTQFPCFAAEFGAGSLGEQHLALAVQEEGNGVGGAVESLCHRRQQVSHTGDCAGHLFAVQDGGPVSEGDPQSVTRRDGEGEGVVGRVRSAESGDGQTGQSLLRGAQGLVVHRVVLEHGQGVEEFVEASETLNLGQAQVLAAEETSLFVLKPGQKCGQGFAGCRAQPYRHGVDEQADHRLDAGNLRRATGHGGAEHDVEASGEVPEDKAPCTLDQGVESEPVGAGRLAKPVCRGGVQVEEERFGQFS
ncbi:hypothetical protein EES39_27875 [Streptomyces sp. ADI92-24]|nr:hypothetical protein EES39_27875 [Streptomyces sp. ADI92-24]